jgi:chitinase
MSDVTAPGRRLSIVRLLVLLAVIGALVAAGIFGVRWFQAAAEPAPTSWFAAYADVTATPSFAFESPRSAAGDNVMLSFIVASSSDGCTPTWGTVYGLDEAESALDLDRRIARLAQQGGEAAVSFGGARNEELATACSDPAALQRAYQSVISRYDVSTIDIDVEGANLDDAAANQRRAAALAALQKDVRDGGGSLAIWLTLPVTPTGLDERAQAVVGDTLAAGVDLAGVNAMTMNYGTSMPDGSTVLTTTQGALNALHRQLDVLYDRVGITLSDRTLWSKVGATPMIGQNDVQAEVFTTDDATALNRFLVSKGVGRVSMWSLNRDTSCGPNYANVSVVSDSCSGVDQDGLRFADLLSADITGTPQFSADLVTTDEPQDEAELTDDPGTSPYPIWNDAAAYLKGTKVVWHHNVYEAKWWTRGDLPDNPVLNDWETPWSLVGPVLPGETPIPQPTLPDGTYGEWDGAIVYLRGDRVLFEGVPYEAKWWTQGDSPAAWSSDPDSAAWAPMTVEQIEDVLDELAGP